MWPPNSSPTRIGRSRLTASPTFHEPSVVFDSVSPDAVNANQRSFAAALVDHRHARAGAGDGGAHLDLRHVEFRGDDDMGVAALLHVAHLADIGDDSGEHGVLLGSGREAFQHIRAKGATPQRNEAGRFVKIERLEGVDAVASGRTQHDGRAENLQPVGETAVEERGVDARPAFHQQPRDPTFRKVIQHRANVGPSARVLRRADDLDAAGFERFRRPRKS